MILPLPAPAQQTGWFNWLDDPRHRSFRFEGASGAECSVIKERRRGRSGQEFDYWYAHRHVMGKLHRVYLGKSENLTLTTLEAAAGKLSQLEMGDRDGRRKNGA